MLCQVRNDRSAAAGWVIAYWLLTAAFIATAALNLLQVRGGFFTSYAADLTLPAWIYIIIRGLAGRRHWLAPSIGRTPETAAVAIFVGSTATEVSQIWWPRGFFAGRYDPWDIAAYGLGLAVCYVADRSFTSRFNKVDGR